MATDFTMMDNKHHGIPSIRLHGLGPERTSVVNGHHFIAPAPLGPPSGIMISAPVLNNHLAPPSVNRPAFQRFISSTTVVQRNLSAGSNGSSSHHSSNNNDELLDDSLTSLNWLQNVKLGPLPGSTPPTSPRNGLILKAPISAGLPTATTVNGGIVAIQHANYGPPGSATGPTYVTTPRGTHQILKQAPQIFITSNGEHHLVTTEPPQITGNNNDTWSTHIDSNGYYTNQAGHITLPPICTVMEPAPTVSSLDQLIAGTANVNMKPTYSYSQLIYFALTSQPEKPQMTLQEIFDWIMENFPYYRTAEPSWQSSVRNNLSLNRCFERVSRKRDAVTGLAPTQKTLWQLSRSYAFLLDSGADDVAADAELSPRRRFGLDTLEEPSKRLKVSGDLTDLFGPELLLNDLLSAESALFSDLAPDGELGGPTPFIPPLNLGSLNSNRGQNSNANNNNNNNGSLHTIANGATPSSEGDTDSIEELLLQDMVNEMNGQTPVDLLTGEALDLTVTGISLRPPPDWWAPEVAELLMGPPPSMTNTQNHPGNNGSTANNTNNPNNGNNIDPLVNSLTASFFASDGSIWANADWDPESLDTFQPAGPNANNNNNK